MPKKKDVKQNQDVTKTELQIHFGNVEKVKIELLANILNRLTSIEKMLMEKK